MGIRDSTWTAQATRAFRCGGAAGYDTGRIVFKPVCGVSNLRSRSTLKRVSSIHADQPSPARRRLVVTADRLDDDDRAPIAKNEKIDEAREVAYRPVAA